MEGAIKPKHPCTTQCFLDRALEDSLSFEAWDSALASDRLEDCPNSAKDREGPDW